MYWTLLLIAAMLSGCGSKAPEPKIALTARRNGDTIRLSWNRGLTAKSAELRIADSSHLKVLPVDPALLGFGSVIYIAASPDVRFDLDLNLDGSRHVVDSVRLIDADRGAVSGVNPAKPPITAEVDDQPRDRAKRPREPAHSTDFKLPPRDLRQIPPPKR